MNGMFSPLPMPVNQTLVPTGGYGTGVNYMPMGARMLAPIGGYATQMPQMPAYPGMFGSSDGGIAALLYQMQNPMMQSSTGSFGENNYLNYAPQFTPSPFAQGLFRGMYNMPFSPVMNLIGNLGLRAYNRASLADVTGDNFSSNGPTNSYSGGRDSDGWGE